jgi:CRISPR-associated exonuclease Cas4
MNVLVVVLVVGALVYIALAWLQSARRRRLGLSDAVILAADDSALGSRTLRSDRLGLVGRPDHLVRINSHVIPVEQKPRARRVHDSHVLQLAAECLLVEETYGVRPPYEVLVLAHGDQHRVPFTPELERRLLQTIDRLKGFLETGTAPGPRWMGARCRACGFYERCWE